MPVQEETCSVGGRGLHIDGIDPDPDRDPMGKRGGGAGGGGGGLSPEPG